MLDEPTLLMPVNKTDGVMSVVDGPIVIFRPWNITAEPPYHRYYCYYSETSELRISPWTLFISDSLFYMIAKESIKRL